MSGLDLLTVPQPYSSGQKRDVLPLRIAYAQELKLAGANNRLIAALLHIQHAHVPRYLDPDGFAIGLLPFNGFIVIDPSPNSDDAVIYDEWGRRKVGLEGEIYLACIELVTKGLAEMRYDFEGRNTLYCAKVGGSL